MKKYIIIGVLGVAAIVGIVFLVKYEMKVYRTIIFQNARINVLDDFITYSFPEQVETYKYIIKNKGSLPTTNQVK